MTRWPSVLSEDETLDRVLGGASLARYGDGEFKSCRGRAIKSQAGHPALAERLTAILRDSGKCLVGIPNLHSKTPKAEYWQRQCQQSVGLLSKRPYASAFISRPDSAPWINTPDYWARLESLWKDRDVTLASGSFKGLTAADLSSARSVRQVIAPRQHAFADYASILDDIGTPERVLLCLGPTATVLAVDLCARGVHAIDLGHVALFLRKYRRGEPMVVTDEDRAVA